MENACRHQCLIYAGAPSRNLPALVAMIQRKLGQKHRCLYLDSPPMVAGMRSYLAAAGLDVVSEMGRGNLVLSSDQSHLADGKFDVERMMQTLKEAVDEALADGYAGLWATGDMTWEFGPERDFSKLVEYEWKLEHFIRGNACLSGVCLYHADTLPREASLGGLVTHTSMFVNETLSRINPHYVLPTAFTDRLANDAELLSALDELCRLPGMEEQ